VLEPAEVLQVNELHSGENASLSRWKGVAAPKQFGELLAASLKHVLAFHIAIPIDPFAFQEQQVHSIFTIPSSKEVMLVEKQSIALEQQL